VERTKTHVGFIASLVTILFFCCATNNAGKTLASQWFNF
jgi:hypothetical protein